MQSLPTTPTEKGTRQARWSAFYWLRGASERRGARSCYTPVPERDEDGRRDLSLSTVTIGVTAAAAVHVGGTQRCGSVWACPLCAPIIRERRAAAVDELLRRALEDGCQLVFVTATASHDRSDELAAVREGIHGAWRKAFAGRKLYGLQTAAGNVGPWRQYVGMVRASDLTVGVNGWHPHIHAVLVFKRRATAAHIARWLDARRGDYLAALGDVGMSASVAHGWDVRRVSARSRSTAFVSRYVAKIDGGWGAGLELARSDLKRGKTSRSAFQLLHDAASGCDVSAELFAEYELATAGKRLIVTGRRLAALYGVDPDAGTDDELALGEVEEPFVVEWSCGGGRWMHLLRARHVGLLIEHLRSATIESRAGPPRETAA